MMAGALASKYRSAPMLHYMVGRDAHKAEARAGTAASLAAQARRDRVTTAAAETAEAVAKR